MSVDVSRVIMSDLARQIPMAAKFRSVTSVADRVDRTDTAEVTGTVDMAQEARDRQKTADQLRVAMDMMRSAESLKKDEMDTLFSVSSNRNGRRR